MQVPIKSYIYSILNISLNQARNTLTSTQTRDLTKGEIAAITLLPPYGETAAAMVMLLEEGESVNRQRSVVMYNVGISSFQNRKIS